MKLAVWIILAAFTLVAGGCRRANAIVVDSSCAAVRGAAVLPRSMSVNGSAVQTDEYGAVRIHEAGIQPPQWTRVSKEGYSESGSIDFADQPKPVRVVLRKSPQSPKIQNPTH